MEVWSLILYDSARQLSIRTGKSPVRTSRESGTRAKVRRIWISDVPLDTRDRQKVIASLLDAERAGDRVICVMPVVLWDWVKGVVARLIERRVEQVSGDAVRQTNSMYRRELRRFLLATGTRDIGLVQEVRAFEAKKGRGSMRDVIIAARLEIDAFDAAIFDVDVAASQLTLREGSEWERGIHNRIQGSEALTNALVLFLNQYRLRPAFSSEDNIVAYAISMPGIIDPSTGTIQRSGRFGIRPPEPPLEASKVWSERLGGRAFVFHDGPSLALGEMKYGIGKDEGLDFDTFVFITVGEGIGSTLFINGKHYRGVSGVAGEFGRIVLDPSGPFSPAAGNNGCVEVYTTRPWINQNILNRFRASGQVTPYSHVLSAVTDPLDITSDMLVAAVKANDPLFIRELDEASKKLGQAISMIVTFFNPPIVILGGELMDKIESFYDSTLAQIEAFTFREALMRDDPPRPGTKIGRARLGPRAQWFGSAEQALEKLAGELAPVQAPSHADSEVPSDSD